MVTSGILTWMDRAMINIFGYNQPYWQQLAAVNGYQQSYMNSQYYMAMAGYIGGYNWLLLSPNGWTGLWLILAVIIQ